MTKITIAAASVCLLVASFSGVSKAQEGSRQFAEVYAECGLGAKLFNNGENASESGRTLAIISNVTWDLGTTAHSSNASSEDQCAGSSATTAAFILNNHHRIESDLAAGEGEYVMAMIQSMGCNLPEKDIVANMRGDLSASLQDTGLKSDAVASSARLFDSLRQHCSV